MSLFESSKDEERPRKPTVNEQSAFLKVVHQKLCGAKPCLSSTGQETVSVIKEKKETSPVATTSE